MSLICFSCGKVEILRYKILEKKSGFIISIRKKYFDIIKPENSALDIKFAVLVCYLSSNLCIVVYKLNISFKALTFSFFNYF